MAYIVTQIYADNNRLCLFLHCKKAVDLLDVPSRNTSLMLKKYNSNVEILCLSIHVFLFPFCYRYQRGTKILYQSRSNAALFNNEKLLRNV